METIGKLTAGGAGLGVEGCRQPTIGLGYSSAGLSLAVLVVWAAAFLVVGLTLFARRSETN